MEGPVVTLEERIGHTLSPTRLPLPALTGVPVANRYEGNNVLGCPTGHAGTCAGGTEKSIFVA